MSLRSPLGRVLGLGSAREGADHWWLQRLTAVALVPLGLWLACSMLRLPLHDHGAVVAWMAAPLNTIALLLLVIAASWHARLGVQVVIEDYVGTAWLKVTLLMLNTFAFFAAAVAGVVATLRVAFGVAP